MRLSQVCLGVPNQDQLEGHITLTVTQRIGPASNNSAWPVTTPLYMKGPLYTHLNESVHKEVTTLDPVMMRVIQKRVLNHNL